MILNNTEVGQFINLNKNILYRFTTKKDAKYKFYVNGEPGFFHIFKHPNVSIATWANFWSNAQPEIKLLENPDKKYVANAIKILKDEFKDGNVDNLTYIENLMLLQNYTKPDIIVNEKK